MKRRIYFLYIIWVQVVAISLSSCDDELTDINRNPNATENPQPAYLLAAAQYHAANLYWGSSTNYNSTLLWVQHWAKIQYTEPDCYNVDNGSFTTTWDTGYATLITDLNAIISSELGNDNYQGIATVWRSWVYLLLTNLYGNIPYSEYAQSVTPAYDSQETVLRGLLEELIAADQLLSTTGGTVEGDLIYGNDITRWKQLAHSLRLRIALELADRDEDTARRVIASLWDNRNSVIDSNDAIARFVFTSSPQWNPWASAFNSRDDHLKTKV